MCYLPSVSEAVLLGSAEDQETHTQPQPEPGASGNAQRGPGRTRDVDEHACQLSGLELIPGTE